MAEKTIQGKPCPKCFSFVPTGAEKCSVCGFELTGDAEKTIPEYNGRPDPAKGIASKLESEMVITCSKCGTENHQDFRFCKICKHPLQDGQVLDAKMDQSEKQDVNDKKISGLHLHLDWKKKPEQNALEDRLLLTDFSPYFDGYSEWQGYVFLVYQMNNRPEILLRKLKELSISHFFKKSSQITMIESGKTFFLGTKQFQLLGDLKENKDVKTVIKSDKTIIKEPVHSKQNLYLKGRTRLKILNQKTSTPYLEIDKKFLIGIKEIANSFKMSEEELRKAGIADAHMAITPLEGGKWLLEPYNPNSFYEEINEIPLIITEDDIVRWVRNDQFAEFIIKVEQKEK
jgi:hypothetical protein